MDATRKAVLVALGALSATKGKAEEIIDELAKRGEVSEVKRAELVERLMMEAKTQRGKFEKEVRTTVQKTLNDLGLLTQKDLKSISKRLAEIEKGLDAMRKRKGGA